MGIEQEYGSAVREQTGYVATWMPSATRRIGDYGTVNGSLFDYHAHLDDIETNPPSSHADIDFSLGSHRSLVTKIDALTEAGLEKSKAILEINFDKESGVDISTTGCQITEAKDLGALARLLHSKKVNDDWNMEHGVVVQVITAASGTILASSKKGAQIRYAVGADAQLSATLVAKLSTEGSYISERHIGVKVVGQGPLSPLFRLAFLRSRLLKKPEMVYRGTEQEIPISGDYYLLVT